MADPGPVSFKFKHARVINVKVEQVEKDKLLSADDTIKSSVYEDDTENEQFARC